MNSNVILIDTLDEINSDIDKYISKSRENVYTECVKEKLDITLKAYLRDMEKAEEFLNRQDTFEVLSQWKELQKTKNKMRKHEDTDIQSMLILEN